MRVVWILIIEFEKIIYLSQNAIQQTKFIVTSDATSILKKSKVMLYLYDYFLINQYSQYQYFMKQHLHKSLSEACSLNVSILSEMPENSRIDPSEYAVEEKDKHQYRGMQAPCHKHQKFMSLLETRQEGYERDVNVKCSMLTDTHIDYFDAIEKALLIENQNLKNHNKFLIEQIKKLYQRRKILKNEALAKQSMILSLKKINKELETTVQILSNDIISQIQSLQQLLMVPQSYKKNLTYRIKTLQDLDSVKANSGSIAQSIDALKQIFSKDDKRSQQTKEESDCIPFQSFNPERQYEYGYNFCNVGSMKYKKALNYTDNMLKKIGKNIINHPILHDLEERIFDFNQDLNTKSKKSRPIATFKKVKTMGG